MKTLLGASTAAILMLAANAAGAQDVQAYGALGYNHASIDLGSDQQVEHMLALRGGVRFMKYFGVEGEFSTDIDDGGKSTRQYAAYLVGTAPAGDKFDLFARVGLGGYEVERDTPALNADSTTVNFGAGAIWWWGQSGLRAEYTRLDNQDDSTTSINGDADIFSVSFTRRF